MVVNATAAALKYLNRNLPGAAILGMINKQMGILNEEEFEERVGNIFRGKLGKKKGLEIIESNLALLRYGASIALPQPPDAPGGMEPGAAPDAVVCIPIPTVRRFRKISARAQVLRASTQN